MAISELGLKEIEEISKNQSPTTKHVIKEPKNGKKERVRKKNGCRGLHFSCHSPHLETEFCKNCNAYVKLQGKKQCECCSKDVVKFLKHTWLSRVLKFGIRQHRNFINDWVMFPEQGLFSETLKEPYTWYQKEFDKKGKPIIDPKTSKQKVRKIKVEEIYVKKPKRSQMLEIKYRDTVYEIEVKYLALALEAGDEDAKLQIINRHIGIKGLRIWIPEGEIMDTKCDTCKSYLRYDKKDNFFCPKCGKIDSFK